MKSKSKEAMWGYIFIAPQVLGVLFFSATMICCVFYLSLTEWNAISAPKFIGIKNYLTEFHDENFFMAIINTIKYSLIYIPFNIIIGLLAAIAINDIKGKSFFRMAFFMPAITGTIAISVVWLWLYDSDFGLINLFLKMIGITGPNWLNNPGLVMVSLGIMAVWLNFGYNMVIYIAGIQAIPSSYYEAANIDGANGVQNFLHITLPLLTPTLFFTVIMTTIASFKVFDQIFIMTNGGPAKASWVYILHIYNTGFVQFRFGESCAASVMFFIVMVALTIFQFVQSKRWVSYEN